MCRFPLSQNVAAVRAKYSSEQPPKPGLELFSMPQHRRGTLPMCRTSGISYRAASRRMLRASEDDWACV
jgi:hypothetical protein